MMRGLWLLLLWVGMGSARADAPRWEDVPLPSPGQALVDTTGTAPEPITAFHEPHDGVADPDRLLTPELTRKASEELSRSNLTLVVYDRARHPVEARVLAEHLFTAWNRSGWWVVASIRPVDAWIIPPSDFGEEGGYRRGLPKAALLWKTAMEQLGREPSGAATAEAWDKALGEINWLGGYPEPPAQDAHLTRGTSNPVKWTLAALVLAVGLFVLVRSTIWKLEDGKGPHNLGAFMLCGLLYTLVYGCALGWVLEQDRLIGVFGVFFNIPWVFIGVRRFCAYFDFNPFYFIGSGCALAALGLYFSLVAFSSELFQVGPLVRTVEMRALPGAAGGAFHLRGATLRKDYTTNAHLQRDGSNPYSAKLAPLVAEGWTPDEPVTAWLLCRSHESYRQEECAWDEPIKNVIVPTPLGMATTLQLIQKAELVTTLRSAPGAKLLSRSADAGAAVTGVLLRGLLLPLFFVAAFMLLAILGSQWDEARGVERPSQMEAAQGRKSTKKSRK